MKTSFLTVNGIRHRICTWGSPKKPKLFLIHGWMETGASFNFLCEHLQDKFYCIAPDLRGFGFSAHTKNPLGYFFYEYIADLKALLNHFSPKEPVTILGHSMGGNIVSMYAGTFPERVSRFINSEGYGIVDMPPALGPVRMREWLDEDTKKNGFKTYKTMKEVADRFCFSNPRLKKEYAPFLAQNMAKKVRGGFKISADPKHKNKNPYLFQISNIIPFWESITANCLLVLAEKTEMGIWLKKDDNEVMEEVNNRLGHFPKKSKRIVIPDCGHMIHHEKPKVLAEEILSFL